MEAVPAVGPIFSVGRILLIVIPITIQTFRILTSSTTIGIQLINAIKIGGFNEKIQCSETMQVKKQVLKNPLQLYLNGNRIIDNPVEQLNKLLFDQQILKIKRCAQSLWNYFPSGIVSIFSMILSNQCVRHEYILLYTQKYVVSAEITKSKDCCNDKCLYLNDKLEANSKIDKCLKCNKELGVKKQACIQVMIWDAQNKEEKKRIYKNYNERFCSRVLKSFSTKKNNIAENFMFPKLLSLWTLILTIYQVSSDDRSLQKFYHLLVRNCKTFARSSLYFLEKNLKKEKVFESIMGLYSDKPGYVFSLVQAGFQCATEKGLEKWEDEFLQARGGIEKQIEEIRSLDLNKI